MTATLDPEEAYEWYLKQIDLLESMGRTGAPTQDERCAKFFGMPFDEFAETLRDLRDELEQSAYLTIIASGEAVLQVDFRARKGRKASVPLRNEARALAKKEKKKGRRIVLEDVLDAWKEFPHAPSGVISEFKQLLPHRHWLAHGRYFEDAAPVPDDPGFAIARFRNLRISLGRIDSEFPRR
jgi:hypothetical protein